MPTYGLYLSTLVHEFIGIYVRKLSNNVTAKLLIKIYTEKPSNVAVFDANEVLDSLKKKDELQKNLTKNK